MELYVPDRPNGTAVIICPGGSYHHLGLGAEGKRSAEWFSSRGVVACLLHYRVSQQGWHYPAPMQDVQRAIQLVREMAEGLGVDERRVGLIGYSAGGHLVTWAGAFAGRSDELAKLGLDPGRSIRPDFVIAVYPVVSMQDDIGHAWSRKSLLGKAAPPQELKDLFSLEMQIPKDMPPVYIVACRDDPVVDFENSERLYGALQAQGVPCEFAQYDWGGHGFGMKDGKFMRAFHWNEALARWLEGLAFLPE
jgi:acetyl esterase/lipase